MKKVPELRLKGFEEEWKRKHFCDGVNLFGGLTYSPKDISNERATLVLRSSNVQDGKIILLDNVFVNKNIVNTENVAPGDIIMVVRNGSANLLGKHAVIQNFMENTVIGAFMVGIKTMEPFFFNALLNTTIFFKEIAKNQGATINQITNGNLRMLDFYMPDEYEQQSIGNFFQALDNLLAEQQNKLENLQKVKKSMLSKMFPKEGQKVPEIRFKGFDGDWEEKTLETLTLVIKGEQINKNRLSVIGKYYVLNGGTEPSGYTETFNTNENTISISEGGNSCGFVYYNRTKFWSGGHNFTLQNVSINNEYLYAYLKSIENNIMAKRVGSGLPNIQKKTLQILNIFYPISQSEQQLIALYFIYLDNLISEQYYRLDKLRHIRYFFLNKMFV
jgi:type I restriction enzyme S subunit